MAKKDDFLDERIRAEDILLGGLGFGDEAKIVSVKLQDGCFSGVAKWNDGEEFEFTSDESPTDLEQWAISILNNQQKK